MSVVAIIVAAGRGTRAGRNDGLPKQYVRFGGVTLLDHTLGVFCGSDDIDAIQVVIHADDRAAYENCTRIHHDKVLAAVTGGATRQESVRFGLESVADHGPRFVLIHDAARPFCAVDDIARVIAPLKEHAGTILAQPVADTLKRSGSDNAVEETVARTGLWRAQTPQAFRFREILDAHRQAADRSDFTDDASIAEAAGLSVVLVESTTHNTKITTPGDMGLADRLLERRGMDVRTGQGFDVHRFADGDYVCLCGVNIPHTQRLDGHSDADVAMHALTDAILGAIGDGDIGQHFPPSDEKWRGAASDIFLRDACRRVFALGARLTNVDVTIICEAPKIGPHREVMRERLADILGIELARVGVKATTSERLGFTGRREGIAAMATATVVFD